MSNKVRYGLKNVHYAPLTFGTNNAPTFGTPVLLPDAVSLSLSRSGEDLKFYANDEVYFECGDNSSFDGDLEVARIQDGFATAMLGDQVDDNGVLVTDGSSERGHFALLFEFTGDRTGTRHVLYNCTASPEDDLTGATRGENIEVQTEKLKLRARPLPGINRVKARTGDNTSSTVYDDWYTSVYVPEFTPTTPTTGNGG